MAKGPVKALLNEIMRGPIVETAGASERDVKKREDIIRHRIESKGEAIESQVERLNAPTGTSLCFRCTHSHIYRRKKNFSVVIRCNELTDYAHSQMADDIEECNRFKQVGKLTIWELMRIAQPIIIDGKDSAGHYW